MPQHQDFGFKPSSRLETVAQHADKKEGNSEHHHVLIRQGSRIQWMGFSEPTTIEIIEIEAVMAKTPLRTKERGFTNTR